MKAPILFTVLLLMSISFLPAQVPGKYRFKVGETVLNVLPESEIYAYGSFKEGKILFANGKSSTAKLNYNLLYGEMEFIDDNGDTLALMNDPIVQNILLGSDLYYCDYQNAFVEVVADFPVLKLGAMEKLVMVRKDEADFVNPDYDHFRKLSQDEMSKKNNPPVERTTYKEYFSNPLEEDLLLVKIVDYYFIDQNNRFHPARKNKIRKIFPHNKGMIRDYIKDHRINFTKEDDLVKLVEFCNQLNVQ